MPWQEWNICTCTHTYTHTNTASSVNSGCSWAQQISAPLPLCLWVNYREEGVMPFPGHIQVFFRSERTWSFKVRGVKASASSSWICTWIHRRSCEKAVFASVGVGESLRFTFETSSWLKLQVPNHCLIIKVRQSFPTGIPSKRKDPGWAKWRSVLTVSSFTLFTVLNKYHPG